MVPGLGVGYSPQAAGRKFLVRAGELLVDGFQQRPSGSGEHQLRFPRCADLAKLEILIKCVANWRRMCRTVDMNTLSLNIRRAGATVEYLPAYSPGLFSRPEPDQEKMEQDQGNAAGRQDADIKGSQRGDQESVPFRHVR